MRKMTDDYWFRHEMPISFKKLLRAINYKYHMLEKQEQAPSIILPLIPAVENRRIVFIKDSPGYVWLMPPDLPPRINKLSRIECWSMFARCLSCDGNKFLPVMMGGKEHAACYGCIPPSQYRALGAKPIERSLICEAAKKYY